MEYRLHKQLFDVVLQQRNVALILNMMFILMMLSMAACMYKTISQQRVVVIPAHVEKPFWISTDSLSANYLYEMTQYFSMLYLNASPEHMESMASILLRYSDPSAVASIKKKLLQQTEIMQRKQIRTNFYPISVSPDVSRLRAFVTGDLVTQIGAQAMPAERVMYQINYRYRDGRLYIISFKEVTQDEHDE